MMPPTPQNPCRVCVLVSSYEGSDSDMKEYEGHLTMSPEHYMKHDPCYTFETHALRKATAYREVRALVKSGRFDVFYNMCDGAKDEDRAGEEVVRTLEEFKVPFTGAPSKYYEMSKPDMKMVAHYRNIPHAKFAVVEDPADTAELCAHLTFPVIVKHISGYSSVGMTRDCKCVDMEALVARVERFIGEFQSALVEEFIEGDEVTVLACADDTAKDGIRVYHPVMISFPEGEDFKHFNLKWEAFEGMQWRCVPEDDPALQQIIDIGRSAFKHMLGGIGFGRSDIRINRKTGEAVFLEINPNCGIMYPPGEEGSADWVLRLDPAASHAAFAALQMKEAIARCFAERPLFRVQFRESKGYHLRSTEAIPRGAVIMEDEGRRVRVFTKPHVMSTGSKEEITEFQANAWPLGGDRHTYATWDLEPAEWRSFNHSCEPNMAFAENGSLNVVACRDIRKGEELTMDYLTFCDDNMPEFECHCGSAKCKKLVRPRAPLSHSKAPNVLAISFEENRSRLVHDELLGA